MGVVSYCSRPLRETSPVSRFAVVWDDHSSMRKPAERRFNSEQEALSFADALPKYKTTVVRLELDGRILEGEELRQFMGGSRASIGRGS